LRSITLDEIANSTKIGTRMLHALEDEEFDKLPGGIFNKGFVRAYAKYLGLDEEQAVTDYLAAETEKERKRRAPANPQEPSKDSQPQLFAIQGGARPDNVYNIRASVEIVENPPDPAGGFLKAAVILVFLLGLGGFGWKYFSSHSASPAAAAQEVPSQPVTSTPVDATANPPQAHATSDVTSSLTSKAVDAELNAQTSATNPAPIADAKTASAPKLSETRATNSATAPGEFTLDLRADEDSWAQIIADGKTVWSGMISKDSAKTFRAGKEMSVKLGNAQGVQLAYNGKALPRFTQDPGGSKTRTFLFTPEGLQAR
jgi:cytoskeleton protein RodZ